MFERTVGLFFFQWLSRNQGAKIRRGSVFGQHLDALWGCFWMVSQDVEIQFRCYLVLILRVVFYLRVNTCRLETGDYQGAARDCTQALRMSDQAISSPLPMLDPIITYYNHQVAMVFWCFLSLVPTYLGAQADLWLLRAIAKQRLKDFPRGGGRLGWG